MLREELRKLKGKHKEALMLAFEQGTTLYVTIYPGYFLGVNIMDYSGFNIIEQSGVWSYGTFKA